MFDHRALLAGRAVPVSHVLYIERAVPRELAFEAFLREHLTRLPVRRPRFSKRFCERVAAEGQSLGSVSDDALRDTLIATGARLRQRGFSTALVARCFAVIREAAQRTLGLRHHDVQLLAGRALLQGKIAEMATGEGKTLAGSLAACTVAASGASVHVVTVNDYLAERDAQTLGPLFAFFGFEVGVVTEGMETPARQAQYDKPIVFVSNKELTFDYLKDCLACPTQSQTRLSLARLAGQTQNRRDNILHGLHFALIDEADSVLIDEARTPLIISETRHDKGIGALYAQALEIAGQLNKDTHFKLGPQRDAWLTPAGEAHARELTRPLGAPWHSELWRREFLQKALLARHVFTLDKDYLIAEGKIQIIDEFTGRVMPDRSWEGGLHQMIETKEGCTLSGQRHTLAQITYQRFFSRYLLTAGMTGTAREIEAELNRVFGLRVQPIPTHRASLRQRHPDRVFATPGARWQAVSQRAAALAATGRAVLIGTRSIEASETLSATLNAHGINHTVLNARQDQAEADTIAQAGQPGQITVATNMAGRGTDIKLHPAVKAAGGLHVILTEFHESPRIDRQLFGRAARQGDPGSVEAMVSLQDELFQTEAPGCTRLAALFTAPHPPGRLAFRALVKWCQFKAGWKARHTRLQTLRNDQKWQQALGFIHPRRK